MEQSSCSLGGSPTAGLVGLRCSTLQRAVAARLLGGMEEHPAREPLPNPKIAVGPEHSIEQEFAASLLVVDQKLGQVVWRDEPKGWARELSTGGFAGGGQSVLEQRLGRLKFVRPKSDLVQHPIAVEAARMLPDSYLSPWTSALKVQH